MADGGSENMLEENVEQHLSKIIKDVRSGNLSLVTFVEELGPQLTSTDVDKRCHGVRLLSDVLHRLVGFQFKDKEVTLFCEFLCDRLKDHYTIIPHALFGCLALVTNQDLTDAVCLKLIQSLFKEVHVQSLLKEGRLTAFNLFAVLLNKHLKALKTIGNDFVFGFIQAVDGEKDPKNLLLVFELVRVIISNFSIDLFAEDLFEVTSCYFPIDFTPPPDDPYGIKKDDLVSSLRKCLAATNQFAPFCFPLLMEKLSSDITDAKIDSLLTLSACLEVYHSINLLEYLEPLWIAIKSVVFHSGNSILEDAGLAAVTGIVRNLCGSVQENTKEKYDEFLEIIQRDCGYLTGNDVKLMRHCGRILQAVALAAEPACQRIIDSTFPLLLEQFTQDVEIFHKKIFIGTITNLLRAAKTFHKQAADSPVVKYKEALSTTLFSFLSDINSSLCGATVECFMVLTDLTGLLNEKEVQLLVEHVTSLVLGSKEASLSQISSAALSQLSRNYPVIIISAVLPLLEMHLKQEDGSAMDTESSQPSYTAASHQYVLSTLGAVCTEESVIHEVIPRLIEHAQHLCCAENSHEDLQSQVCGVFQCILNIVEGSIQKRITSASYFKQSLIPDVMRIVLKSALSDFKERVVGTKSKDILDRIAAIIRTVTSNLDVE